MDGEGALVWLHGPTNGGAAPIAGGERIAPRLAAGGSLFDRMRQLFRPRPIAEDLRRESRALVLARVRLGATLGIALFPTFIPLDFIRLPDHAFGTTLVRVTGCLLLLAVYFASRWDRLEPWAEWLAALIIAIISGVILGVGRFARGPEDPVYLVQSMAIIFTITGSGLLLPVEGRWMLVFGAIPFAMQVLLTFDYDFVQNLPVLASSLTAIVVSIAGAHSGFLLRLGDYEGRRAKETLLEARSEIVAMLTKEVQARRRTEEILRNSEQKYRSLFEDSRDGLVLAASDGRLLDANPAAVTLFGYAARDEFLAQRAQDLYVHPERDTLRLEKLMVQSRGLRDLELELRRKDGRKLDVVVDARPMQDESGQVIGFRTIVRDVTEQKLLEARLRQTHKLEAVGMLAAGVAHEINNPLTYVLTHLETLQEDVRTLTTAGPRGPLAESVSQRLGEAREGAERVRRIVRDLKSFARLGEESRASVGVAAVLEKAIQIALPEIRYRAELVRDFSDVPPVQGNEDRLCQVFVNLLINAAQAIDEGHVERNRITVRTRKNCSSVAVEISDSGRGISPEDLDKLFDPFFTTKAASGGSGLGLSISYNIVAAFGGRIEVESTPGNGSRFFVHLPIAAGDPASASAAAPVAPSGVRARILVVDDEPFVLSTVKVILGRQHDVVGAANGAEALALLERDPRFDLVLCDLMMEKTTGMEFYAALSRQDTALARRIVFMTGGAHTPQARHLLERVSNRCIDKPFGAAELIGLVERALAETRATEGRAVDDSSGRTADYH